MAAPAGAANGTSNANEHWPPALRAAVDVVQLQPLAMMVLWGDEPLQIINRAFGALKTSLEGARWADEFPFSRPDYDAVLATGREVSGEKRVSFEGAERRFDVGLGPLRDGAGEVQGALLTIVETTRQSRTEQALVETEGRLSVAAEAGAGGAFEHAIPVDPALFLSQRWCEILGLREEDLPPWQRFQSWFAERVHPEDRARRDQAIGRLLDGTAPAYEAEFRVRDRAGQWTWVREYARATERSESGTPLRVAGFMQDITKRKATEREAVRLKQQDPLTGLLNRALFRERLALALTVAGEAHASLGLAIVNLDHFGAINQRFGSSVGDEVLKRAADRIAVELGTGAILARLGSDEFVVALPGVAGMHEVEAFANRLSAALAQPMTIGDQKVEASASVGLALFPDHGRDGTALLRHADLALRRAQEIGTREIYVFNPEIATVSERRRELEDEFRRAIEADELLLHYQPQFDLDALEIHSVEALVRWRRPEGTLLHPRHFMALAQDGGLVLPLGAWILGAAVAQARAWADAGHDLIVAVNVSHAEAARPEFLEAFDAAVAAAGIANDRFEFEITGAILASHGSARIRAFLEGCRARGIGLVLDDFGIGYSSTGFLRDLSLAKVKIDTSFVAGVGDGETDSLLEIMVEEGHKLGRRVVAEGVENEAQLRFLSGIGVDAAQGNLLCPPSPAEAILPRIQDRAAPVTGR